MHQLSDVTSLLAETEKAPWTVVKSNDQKRARLEAMRSVLVRFDYPDRDDEVVGKSDSRIVSAVATLLESGEDETDLTPTPLHPAVGGPGLHPEQI